MVEETTAASHRLTREAESLSQIVSQFAVDGAPPVATPAPRPRRAAASVAARPRPTADARALQTRVAETWDEF